MTRLTSRLDGYLRRSALARFVPQLRQRTPRLYRFARELVNRAFPLPSTHGLARHQARAVERFCREVPLDAGSAVLEIGSDREGRVLRELVTRGAGSVVGINPMFDHLPAGADRAALPNGCRLVAGDARNLEFPRDSFSAVFSISVFEHLLDFDRCLDEMYRVLRPGGFVFADFGPIWSCSIGHHVCAFADGQEARHHKPETNPVPNHAHLLQSRSEMQATLEANVTPNLLKEILEWIYGSTAINRLFFEDYVRSFEASRFDLMFLDADVEHVDHRTQAALVRKHPGYARFDVRNARVLLRKTGGGS